MRVLLFTLGILVAVTTLGTGAQAQNYPWCAALNLGDLSYNCGFDTEAQCRATVSGIGGFCNRNTQYVPPPGPHGPAVYRRHRRHPHT